ncbi:MAG: tripartite tricarboxylate transporter substrate binding protein [Thermodesulfobacteriota bacterium]|nr:tripartite tricarboxylate transporter substrate binding protein [Thermodesulfobacteriota bacterium]
MKQKGWKAGKIILGCGLLLMLLPIISFAQPYPTKPINLIVTFPPGGTLDTSTRILAIKAEKILGQPVIVSNVGGGAGSVALGQVAKKRPDGYDITSCASTGLIRIPQLRAVPYSHEDFVPIMHFTSVQSGLVVKSDSPYKTLKDLVEYARKNPGKVNYATSGAGSPMHMAMEYIADKEGIQWTHVPYAGGAPGLTAVLGGHVTAMSDSTEWLPHVKEGSLRLLVTHGERRMKSFPNVPTLRDLGFDFINETVFMIATPKGTPPAIVKKLEEAFHKAMEDPEFVRTIQNLEFDVAYRNSEDTKKYLEDAYNRFAVMIKKLNITKEPEKK